MPNYSFQKMGKTIHDDRVNRGEPMPGSEFLLLFIYVNDMWCSLATP